jgi:hypothetical protein
VNAPGRTTEGVVGDRRKPDLVLAQRDQQMRDAIAAGKLRIGGADAETVRSPAATPHEQRAGLS